MIRLEHANLVVKDLETTLHFVLTAFPEWHIRGRGRNTWHGKPRRWVHVGTDDYYLTLNDGAEGNNRDLTGHTPGLAHLGFVVEDVELVIQRLEYAGFEPRTRGAEDRFRKTVYFVEPSGFEFEFMEYLSDDPREKNHYSESGETTVDTA
ncbi:MAG: VOC family protein [Gammaproteobacteria bacterium]|nr:MAG: VOC family protein [Gammaproteobacteria bacterium]